MIGSNTIKLNRATMNKAVEHWLNSTQLKTCVEVREVRFQSSANVKFDGGTFCVSIAPAPTAEEKT